MKKRILSILLLCSMVLTMLPTSAFADKTQLSDKLNSSNKSLPDCIIFSDILSDAMDRFLAEYKKRGIEPTHLKAIVTVHNMKWSVDELINELKKEQIAIMMRGRRQ